MLKDIQPSDAVDMLFSLPVTAATETVTLADALSRVCARDVTARIPVPPFDRSPYDGYAFRGEDTKGAAAGRPTVLRITEEIPAGKAPGVTVTTGTAAKILTGAPMPKGANATIKYEDTEFTANEVRIFREIAPDTDIVRAGQDVAQGGLIARAGEVITPPVAASLANQGFADISVFKRPVITIINTGTELREVGEPLGPAMIYSSSVYMLGGYLAEAGTEWINGGIVPDDAEIIAERITEAFRHSEMVITTGGASVGDYDWAVRSAELTGARVLFWKTAMKPGGSLMAAEWNGKVLLGLSGNPAAAVLGLHCIAMPYIKKLCGRADCYPRAVEVTLKEPYEKKSPKLRLVRGRLVIEDGAAYFTQMAAQGSEAVSSLVGCDLLGEIPAKSPPLPAGARIKAYVI